MAGDYLGMQRVNRENKSSKLIVADNEVLFEQGLLNKDRSELDVHSMRNVKVKQTFFNRLLGTGTLELYTPGDTPEIVVNGMLCPILVKYASWLNTFKIATMCTNRCQ